MRIDITEIAGVNGASISVERDIPSSELVAGYTDVELDKNVHVDLKIEYIEGIITVSGKVSGKYNAVCARAPGMPPRYMKSVRFLWMAIRSPDCSVFVSRYMR